MNKITATRIIKFDAGHRVVNHESKCRTLHGHEYKAHIFAEASNLDSLGRIIDFSVIKEKIGEWIDDKWDHNMILWEKDPNLKLIQQCDGLKQPFIMKTNPTAENLALYLINEICPELLIDSGVEITKIRLYETSNCYVEVFK
jgi:6-pyruvoyltetrahydropterin/6-carboxytetrahydropterin synthase